MKQIFKNIKPFFLILLIPLFFGVLSYFRSEKMLKNKKFTIGEITSEWHSQSTFKSFGVDYTYIVDDEVFTKQISKDLKKGNKYLVVYDSLNPNNAMIIPEYYMNIYKIPENGWHKEELPIKVSLDFIENQ